MPTPPASSIREQLLSLIAEMETKREGGNLQQNTLLSEVHRRMVPRFGDPEVEQAILTLWHELFRTGLLAWGHNLNNPDPPFFHLTAVGHRALANASRDPANPAGYLRHLQTRGTINPVAMSYVAEGLDCYVAGLYKAAAVMVGAAAEALLLELRDLTVDRLTQQQQSVEAGLADWKIRTVTTALARVFDARVSAKQHRSLREQYETYWLALTGMIRTARNDAGHPSSIDPVTPDAVHAALLVFPELCGLSNALRDFVLNHV